MGKETTDSLNCFRDYLEDVKCMMEEGRCNPIVLSHNFFEIVDAVIRQL